MSIVSVIIASYNSTPFIIETLESVLRQTWKEIELIITDDCSEDDTVVVCRNWLNENSKRFVRSEILVADMNNGIPANVNRGLKAARGEWIKFLGADDTLKPNCIEDNLSWLASNTEVKVLFSSVDVYKDTFEPQNLIITTPGSIYNSDFILNSDRTVDSQYRMLLLGDRIHFTPSVFLNRETIISVGGFDERFRLLEDYPLWLNLTRNGHKLYFMDKITINYRRHSGAINNTGISWLINPNYFKTEEFRRIYTYPYLPVDIRLNQRYIWYVTQLFRFSCINRNIVPNRFFLILLSSYLNPFKYFIYFKKRISKNLKNNEFYM